MRDEYGWSGKHVMLCLVWAAAAAKHCMHAAFAAAVFLACSKVVAWVDASCLSVENFMKIHLCIILSIFVFFFIRIVHWAASLCEFEVLTFIIALQHAALMLLASY